MLFDSRMLIYSRSYEIFSKQFCIETNARLHCYYIELLASHYDVTCFAALMISHDVVGQHLVAFGA